MCIRDSYICSPIQNNPSQLRNVNFVVNTFYGSGNATAKSYSNHLPTNFKGVLFINPTLFYGNEFFEFYFSGSGNIVYIDLKAQQFIASSFVNGYQNTPANVSILANSPLYVIYNANGSQIAPEIWGNNAVSYTHLTLPTKRIV